MRASADTIAAIATAPGRAGVGVVRVSGTRARAVAEGLLGSCPPARQAVLRDFRDAYGEAIDRGLALWFAAPASYTGEDVLELQGHGGPVVLQLLVLQERRQGQEQEAVMAVQVLVRIQLGLLQQVQGQAVTMLAVAAVADIRKPHH